MALNRGRYGQRHRCSGGAGIFYIDCQKYGITAEINILRHSRRFFRCACKALLPAAP
ncbi:hypothetical protein YD01_000469 [Salmonella enterica subsp. enterica]|nr:hypothetical protein [Salmonella enterica subsp. enterica]EDW6121649.1 hypothetical protein [Salmonella enterica subsp. enterica]